MSIPASTHLRLFKEQVPAGPAPLDADTCELFAAFEDATGWPLEYAAGENAARLSHAAWSMPLAIRSRAAGHLLIPRSAGHANVRRPLEGAVGLAEQLGALLSRFATAQQALAECAAELATAIPVVGTRSSNREFAEHLEEVLRAGALGLGCQAAGLWLLDDATSQLSLRAAWNLPADRMCDEPRPLALATADLEALCGHAVVLERDELFTAWNVPEACGAAVCLPVSSAMVPLGTVWFFAASPRPFSDAEVNTAELVAAKLAADLEREVLIAETASHSLHTREIEAAARVQQGQRPSIAPLIDGWQIAGWTQSGGALSSGFHDWLVRGDGTLVPLVGEAGVGGVSGALVAAEVRSSLRLAAQHAGDPRGAFDEASASLWSGSAGDRSASAFCGFAHPSSGSFLSALAGQTAAAQIGPTAWKPLGKPSAALGTGPITNGDLVQTTLGPGEIVLAVTPGALATLDATDPMLALALLADALQPHLATGCEALVEIVRDRIDQADTSIVLVQRV